MSLQVFHIYWTARNHHPDFGCRLRCTDRMYQYPNHEYHLLHHRSYRRYITGLPAGVTGNWLANVVTISGTPSASGTFNYTVTLTRGCVCQCLWHNNRYRYSNCNNICSSGNPFCTSVSTPQPVTLTGTSNYTGGTIVLHLQDYQ